MHYLAEHQTFDSTDQLNESVYEHIKRNTYELNDTDRRALNKLAGLGIVKKVATTRKINGGKGANIIVILPVNNASEAEDDQSTMSNR
ncbi:MULTISPECIES: hypothetical protein [Bacillus]|uniref:Uncharacterized protein n=1 Tax=Bacillus subtilis TaxID=1423 RepID=A0AAX3RI98_BACIU|nr:MULTISPECIES: hypothetical protein [Bacillus]AOR97648.1 hypothetical protein BSBS38_01368 [Bacillus subtilis]ARV98183.1 hypothetical protein S101444_01335 [Bacillus subtilis subsp. subtilis]ARW02261.1 hypothetical protein S100757_01330 [Bacillus subtilis subsp. subtilis]ARW30953.1 hypothetical protein S101441_01404 [Bacillus subtilis subsp. subtilis]ASB56666.1 hypothetical protein S100761_01337 [Bacillus subtilis subsp. subtilis]